MAPARLPLWAGTASPGWVHPPGDVRRPALFLDFDLGSGHVGYPTRFLTSRALSPF